MAHLIGISGSLRRGSFNTALLNAARPLVPEGSTLEVATLHGITLYDGDVEAAEGIPPAVAALKERIAAADGLVLATPEYNNSMPGVLKNAIDWLSRPSGDIARVFGGKPVTLIGASPGPFGTLLAQAAWLPVLRVLGLQVWTPNRLLVSRAGSVFADDGTLADDKTREALAAHLGGFVRFAGAQRRP